MNDRTLILSGTPWVAIDPGKKTGVALFRGDSLKESYALDGDNPIGLRIISEGCKAVIVEWPTYYPNNGKAAPADLIKLAFRAGLACGMVPGIPIVHAVEPRRWKKQVPKRIHHPRILAALRPEELRAGRSEDEIDAIGLGLWAIGRLQ